VTTGRFQAANPLCPHGVFLADPEAHQWADGNLYVYGSLDESRTRYCSRRYDMLWTADGRQWHHEPSTFSTEGVTGAGANLLYAPDAAYHDKRYHLFYCLSDGSEGVASADHPLGPFGEAQPLVGLNQIDPAVFIDDDGQGYLYWGQFSSKAAKLTPDLRGIVPGTLVEGLVTEKEHFFHEGCSIRKRKGIYYLSYAHIGRRDRPTCIGYATSTSPLGPFTYRGVIIDNFGCDPEAWNNHGSLTEFNGEWFIFYHRPTHASRMMRKTCAERVFFAEDGSIPEVQMTSSGIGDALPAASRIEAGQACQLRGNVRITEAPGGFSDLSGIHPGDAACYRWLDFGRGAETATVCVAGGGHGGEVEIRLDGVDGPLIGKIPVSVRWPGDWAIHAAELQKTVGIHEVWLIFRGKHDELFDLRWLRFS
jgi:arabinoxylan arabinofuranohydrolase